ncbi:SNF2-related protein [Methanomassiliicoccales archaeon LGM-RCC1]|nr:SNF2-related protein [Methanomassiliicoccales archaeon LGM-RCC1]
MTRLDELQGYYDSSEKDLLNDFYIPFFRAAKRFDRVSCYFSSKALAAYSQGLVEFVHKPDSKYRLIVSEDIEKEDFDAITKGEKSLEDLDPMFLSRLREDLTLDEEDSLQILTDLISAGVVEIKIALVRKGIFHYKWGYAEGYDGDAMLMLGSNNETAAAIEENYESFDFRRYESFDSHKENFERMWNDDKPGMIVKKPSEVVWKEIKSHSHGGVAVIDEIDKTKNCIFLDFDGSTIVLDNRLDNPPTNYAIVYKSDIKRFVSSFDKEIVFRKDLDYISFQRIISNLGSYCHDKDIRLAVSKRLMDYINSHDLIIQKRRKLGIDIKNRAHNIMNEFIVYKKTVDEASVRHLYDQQMWDSFFMYAMMKAGNFSVPGSGKTASVLGVLAYLKSTSNLLNMVVVCPLNSFDSWISEYRAMFGREPKVFDSRDHQGTSSLAAFFNSYATVDMVLINYQSLWKYASALNEYLISKCLLVFDEGHYIKGWSTKRSAASRMVAEESTRTLVLTGTPMPNSYSDLYSILHILFPKEYGSYFKYDLSSLRNPTQSVIQDINDKIQPFYCRTSKDDLGVPPENPDIQILVESTNEENLLYSRIKEVCAGNPLTWIIRLLQAESDPSMLLKDEVPDELVQSFKDESTDDYNPDVMATLLPSLKDLAPVISKIGVTSKTRLCIDQVSMLVREGKTVIVWCIFRKSIYNIKDLLGAEGISCESIDGSVPVHERSRIINDFKGGRFSVLITNPHTLAESVSLHTVCHDTIYYEYSYNLVHLLQSKDRIHRLGLSDDQYTQHRFMKVTYGGMMLDGISSGHSTSLDDEIYNRLKIKETIMKEAIETGKLEGVLSSSDEDIREIFSKMGWD